MPHNDNDRTANGRFSPLTKREICDGNLTITNHYIPNGPRLPYEEIAGYTLKEKAIACLTTIGWDESHLATAFSITARHARRLIAEVKTYESYETLQNVLCPHKKLPKPV